MANTQLNEKAFTTGDIVDFTFPGGEFMGKIIEVYQADVVIAKIRCEVNRSERFFYVPLSDLKPARFPLYYKD